jgi:lysophospholipase L1-like esterase
MRKEWLLAIGVSIFTLLIALGLIRWFAPQLLGIPLDLQAVQVGKVVAPFYESVFRKQDAESATFLLKDPYTNVRGRPFLLNLAGLGPHDLLGFRNRSIPNIADVVTIGDSQTYGNDTVLSENWPSQVEANLRKKMPASTLYNMAIGGWCAVQYLNMFNYATFFSPRVIVVAFYTGNDADESVTLAYSVDHWAALRPENDLDLSDKPRFPGFPVPPEEQWTVDFKGGVRTVFTPSLRLVSNDTSYATVRAGYQIIRKVAQLMANEAAKVNIHLVLTVIPTKELVYAERVRSEGIVPTPEYSKLVALEQANINDLAESFKRLPNVDYVDLVEPLRTAAATDVQLYPQVSDGHPMVAGNTVIAEAMSPTVAKYLKPAPRGFVGVRVRPGVFAAFLVTSDGLWTFSSREIAAKNGWTGANLRVVQARDLAGLTPRGTIYTVNPERFGPKAVGVASAR